MIMNKRYFLGLLGGAAATLGVAKGEDVEAVKKLEQLKLSDIDEHNRNVATRMFNYRTDGAWGLGAGAPLTPAQVDENFWRIEQIVRKLDARE